jgi:hypothetical protein
VAHETVVVSLTGLRVNTDPLRPVWGRQDGVISSIAVGLVTGQEVSASLAHLLV